MNNRMILFVCLMLMGAVSGAVSAQNADSAAGQDTAVISRNPLVVNKDTAAVKSTTAKAIDLDKLLAEDDEGDLLVEEKPAARPDAADSAVVDPSSVPAKTDEQLTGQDQEKKTDSPGDAGQPAYGQGQRGRGAPVPPAEDDGPAVIQDGRTINFAQNLKEYRSPRVAMLLSLLVPGLGQAYSKSYAKTAAFGAAEVTVIGVAAYFNSAGKSKKSEAYRFADEHFDVNRIKSYETRLRDEFKTRELEDTDYLLPYEIYDDEFYNSVGKSYYYESIRYGDFTPGWRDSDPDFDRIFSLASGDTVVGAAGSYMRYYPEAPGLFYLIRRVADNTGKVLDEGPMLGYSDYQARYNSIMNESKSNYDLVNYTFYVLLINHIASAIDAGFTARAYNARLLGRESAWERISVEQQYVFTGSEMSPGLALKVRF